MLRERKRAQFEEKRNQATQKMESGIRMTGMGESIRGQLGQPLRQFSEVSGHLSKLHTSLDQIIMGQLTVSELYDQADAEMLSNKKGFTQNQKQQQVMMANAFRSGSALGADEIDSECRTEDGEPPDN